MMLAFTGRAWDAVELRRKSFDDLHKLWYILTLERNVLYSQKEEARRMNVDLMSYSYVSEQLLRVRAYNSWITTYRYASR